MGESNSNALPSPAWRLGYAVLRLPDGIVLEAPDEFMRRVEDCVWSLPNVFTGDL